jgi:hypothetical protein
MTKQSKIISKPSKRHLGGISKECKRIEIEKKNYNFTSCESEEELTACVSCCKISMFKTQTSKKIKFISLRRFREFPTWV